MDRLTPDQRRRNMQAIKSKNTQIEIILGKVMWSNGIRYRKNNRKVFGVPDFTISKYRIAIFCDSEFWHGKDIEKLRARLKTNKPYWTKKIENNISRDEIVNKTLTDKGWLVIRFWETEIKKNSLDCFHIIKNALEQRVP